MSYETPDPARHVARELKLPIVCARKAVVRVVEFVGGFSVPREPHLDLLTVAERRDVANALPCSAWSAALAKTRVLLFDLLIATDAAAT